MKLRFLTLALLVVTTAPAQNAKHPFTFEDMMQLKRVGEPSPSPDSKWVILPAGSRSGGQYTKVRICGSCRLRGEFDASTNRLSGEDRPRFSPDGKRLIFDIENDRSSQIWMCDFDSQRRAHGEPHQVTRSRPARTARSGRPMARALCLSRRFTPMQGRCLQQKARRRTQEEQGEGEDLHELFYRHWNAFTEFKRSHLFVIGARRTRSQGPHAYAISRPAITMCRLSTSAARTCMRFRRTARKSLTPATSMKSKRPARTTKFHRSDGRRHAKEDLHQSR